MGAVYVIVFLQFLWLVGSLIGGVVTFCMSIISIFQRDFMRLWKFLLATIILIVPAVAFVLHYYGPLSHDKLSAIAFGGSFILVFTFGYGLFVSKRHD
jgi:hypothetical protein